MKKITIITLVVTFLAACSKDDTELNPGSSTQNATPNSEKVLQTRTFRATINAAANPNSPPTSCSGVIPFAAPDFILSGSGIHLGQMDAQTSSLHHISCDVDVTTSLLTTSVNGQLAAANGDLIYYEGNDVVNVAALLTQNPVLTGAITGTWNIIGGTGRFQGASGTLTIDGIVDFVTFSFNCECVGTITY